MYLGIVPRIAIDGGGPVLPGPMPVWPGAGVPRIPIRPTPPIIIRGPITNGGPPNPPSPMLPPANAGTPVPAGFPTNQLFVNSDGSFWQFSGTQWINVGTPYNTGVSATPPATPPGSTGGATSMAPTIAPAPTPASATPIVTGTTYQEILDWLTQDSLAQTVGFSIPNWITASGIALLLYKVSNRAPAGRR
jgi:hypothetical protein